MILADFGVGTSGWILTFHGLNGWNNVRQKIRDPVPNNCISTCCNTNCYPNLNEQLKCYEY